MLGVLAMRIWVSDLLHAGDWPWWYPYARYGHPLATLHFLADEWSPMALLLGRLARYDVWTLAVENVLWRGVGLLGVYVLLGTHVRSNVLRVAGAICYAGSGIVSLAVANASVFPAFALTPWLLVGIDRAASGKGWRGWCRTTGTLALAGAVLLASGYPGTWLTAPALVAPYGLALVVGYRRPALRLLGAVAVGGLLALGMLAPFVAETLTFPGLFGGSLRNAFHAADGALEPGSLFGLWAANPTYVPGLGIENLQALYVGILPALLACARLAPLAPPAPRWVRAAAVTLAGVCVALPATLWPAQVMTGTDAARWNLPVRPDTLLGAGLALLAVAAFPRRLGRWERRDTALAALAAGTLAVATRNPIGDLLRAEVPPFSLVRWNYLYCWTVVLAVAALGMRTVEQTHPLTGYNRRQRAGFATMCAAAVALVAGAWLIVDASPWLPFVPPSDSRLDRSGTMMLAATLACLLLALVAWTTFRRVGDGSAGDRPGVCRSEIAAGAAGWVLAGGALLFLLLGAGVGVRFFGNETVVRGFVYFPPGTRPWLDVAQQALVLSAAAGLWLHARDTVELRYGLALLACLDVCVAANRYLSDGGMLVANQGPATVPHVIAFTPAAERTPDESASLNPALAKQPAMWAWPGLVPAVAAADQTAGEPSIFRQFVHFPAAWTRTESELNDAVTVAPEAFRGNPIGASTPRCGPAAGASRRAGATVTRQLSSDVALDVQVDCDRLLVYTDTWAPGWRVWVDGAETQALHVNDAIRGVLVPAGRHTVEWRYRPRWLPATLLTLCISAAGALLLVAAPPYYGRRRTGIQRGGYAS